MLLGGFLMCAGFVFVGGTIWYGRHLPEHEYLDATAYATPMPPPTAAAPAPLDIPPGMRAITLRRGPETGAFLSPGSRVDIIGKVPETENAEKLVTKVVVDNVLVLSVNTREAPLEDEGPITSGATLTVAVTVDQAERIAAAKERGRLTVVLRRPGE
jgi:Flp pilus assembly protein CpaB